MTSFSVEETSIRRNSGNLRQSPYYTLSTMDHEALRILWASPNLEMPHPFAHQHGHFGNFSVIILIIVAAFFHCCSIRHHVEGTTLPTRDAEKPWYVPQDS